MNREAERRQRGSASLANLVTALLAVVFLFSVLILASKVATLHLPGNEQGYEPVQPIAFSHRLHAGELEMECLYCHFAAARGPSAGIPAAGLCMNCHRFVTAPLGAVRAEERQAADEGRPPRPVVSAELAKLYDALGLDGELKPARAGRPIEWVRVHSLPDFVAFDHRAHVGAGVACQRCHGAVETMERVRQVEDLSMGWCVNCHRLVEGTRMASREVHPSIDCVTCHY